MIIFVITNPTYIRDRNSDEIDVGKLLLATLIASTFGVVIIWLISVLIRSPRSNQSGDPNVSKDGQRHNSQATNIAAAYISVHDQHPNNVNVSQRISVHSEQADAVRSLSEY
jgi:hypothetical protein